MINTRKHLLSKSQGLFLLPAAVLFTLSTVLVYSQTPPPPSAAAPPGPTVLNSDCPAKSKRYVFTPQESGEVVQGPACVGVKINALRYTGVLGLTVTYTAGPNLATSFAAPAKFGGGGPTVAGLSDQLIADRAAFNAVDALNSSSAAAMSNTLATLKSLVSRSDDIFTTNGAAGVVSAAQDPQLTSMVEAAAKLEWKPTDGLYSSLRQIQATANDLLLKNPSDADTMQLTIIQSQTSTLITDVTASVTTSDKAAAFQKQKATLQAWKDLIAGLKVESFIKQTYVPCGSLFNQNKQVAVRLLRTDRLPMFDGQALTQTDLKDPFVTVSCASPFAVSAGVEFSFLNSPTFGLVPSGSSGANQFNVTDQANINPLPIAMVHGRLGETADHKYGLYASFGIAAHIQGAASGGSTAEFLTGLSIGFLRTIFITPGWHIGKVAALSGGYTIGGAVPTGVTVVPVKSSYQSGFGLAITFTKP